MPEAHNPSRSVSGTVCVFVPCYGKRRGEDSSVLTNWLSSVFSIIFVITQTIVLHLKVINFNRHLWYPPLQSAVLVHNGIIFVPKDIRYKSPGGGYLLCWGTRGCAIFLGILFARKF